MTSRRVSGTLWKGVWGTRRVECGPHGTLPNNNIHILTHLQVTTWYQVPQVLLHLDPSPRLQSDNRHPGLPPKQQPPGSLISRRFPRLHPVIPLENSQAENSRIFPGGGLPTTPFQVISTPPIKPETHTPGYTQTETLKLIWALTPLSSYTQTPTLHPGAFNNNPQVTP